MFSEKLNFMHDSILAQPPLRKSKITPGSGKRSREEAQAPAVTPSGTHATVTPSCATSTQLPRSFCAARGESRSCTRDFKTSPKAERRRARRRRAAGDLRTSKKSISSSAMPVCAAMFCRCPCLLPLWISSMCIVSFMHRSPPMSNLRRHSCAHSGLSVQLATATTLSFQRSLVFSSASTSATAPSMRTLLPRTSTRSVPVSARVNGAPPPHSMSASTGASDVSTL
mmetsp:Transcript_30423/g.78904  ORF Transcript_30423/g.78904 Transcript_30423/m.78904 type:complete len:226 (-) Transcript_30423:2937-3614(-)